MDSVHEIRLEDVVSIVRTPHGVFIELKDARALLLQTAVIERVVLAQHGE